MITNSLKNSKDMKANINKSQLFKMAHTMLRKAEANNMSEALIKAWKAVKLKATMMVGKAKFAYRKLDGTIREAIGTLFNLNYTPKTPANGKPRKARPDDIICYFDIESNGFRSFNAANLI